ncbi:MAG: hypothetical protein K0Q68_80 [Moraxellaceae bacterium]|jgi:hypothetical protein|nr:hypothetical protein [Moraxellaceae bacterium]
MDEYEYESRVRIIELVEAFKAGTADMRELIYWLHGYSTTLSHIEDIASLLSPLDAKGAELDSIPKDDQAPNWAPAAWARVKKTEAEIVDYFTTYLNQHGEALLTAAGKGL